MRLRWASRDGRVQDWRNSLAVGQEENTRFFGSQVGAAADTHLDPQNRSSTPRFCCALTKGHSCQSFQVTLLQVADLQWDATGAVLGLMALNSGLSLAPSSRPAYGVLTIDTWVKTGSVTLSQTSLPASTLYRQRIPTEAVSGRKANENVICVRPAGSVSVWTIWPLGVR